ncbi:MAG TPA: EamA family transporter [Chloroflexi bacterium]|nr:EamA family transporter [Chloroflexota bacterium]HPO57813.1 EamA family transporter [Anaerolineaceae bacterium]
MKSTPFVIALLSALFFGAAAPLSKPLLAQLTSSQLAGLLYLGAAAGVVVLLAGERRFTLPWRMKPADRLRLLGAVVFGGVLGPLFLLAGLRMALAASVSMWLNLEMVATAVLGHFIFKDHLTRRSWLAVGGIFLASALLAAGEGLAGVQAGLLVALACLCWGIDNHLTALIDGITPAQSTFWKGLVAGSTNLAIGLALAPLTAPAGTVAAGLGLGVVSYGLSIVFYITAAQQLGATRSQLIFSSAPFWGVLLSLLWLGEAFTPQLGLGIGLFVLSIGLLFREQHAHAHTHRHMAHEHFHSHLDGHHNHTHPDGQTAGWHSHPHEHEPVRHAHPHWPDLHHRHAHTAD